MFKRWNHSVAEAVRLGQPTVLISEVLNTKGADETGGFERLLIADRIGEQANSTWFEAEAVSYAKALIAAHRDGTFKQSFCSGDGEGEGERKGKEGAITLRFQVFNSHQTPLYLFGAGYLVETLAPILRGSGFKLVCINTDRDSTESGLDGVEYRQVDPLECAENLPSDAWALVMTHDHPLDFKLTLAAARSGCAYVGMIGSTGKAHQLQQLLEQADVPQLMRERIICPIGLSDLKSNSPMEIAVSITADLLLRRQSVSGDP